MFVSLLYGNSIPFFALKDMELKLDHWLKQIFFLRGIQSQQSKEWMGEYICICLLLHFTFSYPQGHKLIEDPFLSTTKVDIFLSMNNAPSKPDNDYRASNSKEGAVRLIH